MTYCTCLLAWVVFAVINTAFSTNGEVCKEYEDFPWNIKNPDEFIALKMSGMTVCTCYTNGSCVIRNYSPIQCSVEQISNDAYKVHLNFTSPRTCKGMYTLKRSGINSKEQPFIFQCEFRDSKAATKFLFTPFCLIGTLCLIFFV